MIYRLKDNLFLKRDLDGNVTKLDTRGKCSQVKIYLLSMFVSSPVKIYQGILVEKVTGNLLCNILSNDLHSQKLTRNLRAEYKFALSECSFQSEVDVLVKLVEIINDHLKGVH